jgi:hypothetical protein
MLQIIVNPVVNTTVVACDLVITQLQ